MSIQDDDWKRHATDIADQTFVHTTVNFFPLQKPEKKKKIWLPFWTKVRCFVRFKCNYTGNIAETCQAWILVIQQRLGFIQHHMWGRAVW